MLTAKLFKINHSEYRFKALHKSSTERWFVLDYEQGLFYYKDKVDDIKNWSGVIRLSSIDGADLIPGESDKALFGFRVRVAGNVHVEARCPATTDTSSRFVADNWVAELNRAAGRPELNRPEDNRPEEKAIRPENAKVIIIGDAGVGKTCLVRGYVGEDTDGKATIGVDFLTKRVVVNGAPVKLHIYDTAGQEKHNCLNRLYYRDAQVVFIVFDLTQQKSFDECETWLQQAHQHCNDPVIVLVGNKSDKVGRVVSAESARMYARSRNLEYFETSALRKDNVDTPFNFALQTWSRSPHSVSNGGDIVLDPGRNYHTEVPSHDVTGRARRGGCGSC